MQVVLTGYDELFDILESLRALKKRLERCHFILSSNNVDDAALVEDWLDVIRMLIQVVKTEISIRKVTDWH